MPRIVTVLGATGIQGGSVVAALLDNPAYAVRAITRNAHSDAAKGLSSRGVTVVEANTNDVESLRKAFAGSYAIFALTNFFDDLSTIGLENAMKNETRQGINLANAAAATESLEHYVWSTLPNSRQNSGGKIVVTYYESKNQVDSHIESLPHLRVKTTFLWLGWYASNILKPVYMPNAIKMLDGSKYFVQILGTPGSTILPVLGDETKNSGLFVKAILDQPQKTLGRYVAGFDEWLSLDEVLAAFASAQKVQARTLQVSREDYVKLWPVWADGVDKTHYYLETLGSKGFTHSEEPVVTKEDLGIKGLVTASEFFATLPQLL